MIGAEESVISTTPNIVIALQVVVGTTAIVLWLRKKNETRPKKLHVDYGTLPPPALPMKIIASLPDWIRSPLLVRGAKPSQPRDSIDVLGTATEVDPYEKWEILPGKLWGVRYTSLMDPEIKKFFKKMGGGSEDDTKRAAIENAPARMKKILENDFEAINKYDEMSEEERAKAGGDSQQDMFVAKIDINDDMEKEDQLILFNPIRMHPQMIDWIKQLGEVKYIVSGSSAHTNHLPGTATVFPAAKIICASAADSKCQAVGMRPADYLYDLRREDAAQQCKSGHGMLEDACDALNGQAKIFHVKGDTMTQALFLLVHNHLFEMDLVYVPSDDALKEMKFETGNTINHSKHRVLHFSLVSEKALPIGYKIPMYRCMFMDPTTLFGSKMTLDAPNPDGSSCTEMAQSLRKILKTLREPGVCERVHDVHFCSMSLEDFCERLDQTWGWLDGESFIE